MTHELNKLSDLQINWLRFTLADELKGRDFISADIVHDALVRANDKLLEYAKSHGYAARPSPVVDEAMVERLTRPITSIEHRTSYEAFGIMCDRINAALSGDTKHEIQLPGKVGTGSYQDVLSMDACPVCAESGDTKRGQALSELARNDADMIVDAVSPKPTVEPGLVKRLNIKAGMIELGEGIAYGSDSAIMREAAAQIEALEAERDSAIRHRDLYKTLFKTQTAQVEKAFKDGVQYANKVDNADPEVAWQHSKTRATLKEGE